MIARNKFYKILKWFARYFLPILGVLYFVISNAFVLQYETRIIVGILLLNMILNLFIKISTSKHTKKRMDADGILQIDSSNPNKDLYRLLLNDDLGTLVKKKQVIFTIDAGVKLSD